MAKKVSSLLLAMPLPPVPDHLTGAQLWWRKRALAEIDAQRPAGHGSLAPHARVRVLIGIVHGRALVDVIPAALAVLADAGVIGKLDVITDIEARWDRTVEPGRMQIEIAPTVPPLRRIGASVRQRIREKTINRWARARSSVASVPATAAAPASRAGPKMIVACDQRTGVKHAHGSEFVAEVPASPEIQTQD